MQKAIRVNVNDKEDMRQLNKLLDEGWEYAAGFAVPTNIAFPDIGTSMVPRTFDPEETSPIALVFLKMN